MTNSHADASRWLPLLSDIADIADEIALRWFGEPRLRVDDKSDGSPVSEADRAIEAMARKRVSERHPELGVFGEEEGDTSKPGEPRLIIDPIDGTRNFVRGIPIFASLLAIEHAGVLLAGLVSAPALRARWHATHGGGAFRDGKRIHVSPVADLSAAHLFHADLSGRAETAPPERLQPIFRRVLRTRGFGDFYQHMLVAEGAGEIAIDPKVKPWDVAAVKIVVVEAGGRSTSFAGDEGIGESTLLSTNGLLHQTVVNALALPAAPARTR
ncbi:MAG TPA: inositol monophosphatase family protein [Candidatus Krumholzibacteria bacterium]|nr:inositol monophosphatase family protein [Candidatus Krumholzibacteria bacterium]